MPEPTATVWPLDVTHVAILADCHIHPGGGPAFPAGLFEALEGADLIVTLGDMGEAAALDQLSAIAPVIGVRGQDDSDDPRTDSPLLVLAGDDVTVGCVFDAIAAGLATSSDPFRPVADFAAASARVFGRPIDILLFASTHKPEIAAAAGCQVLNPGSAVLPGEGARATFGTLTIEDGAANLGLAHLD
ncbi:MAG: metallophosphoesterase family protein [Phenylobacterium sp.]